MELTYDNFCVQLALLDPESLEIYQRHTEEQGELLSHVFLAEWGRWIIAKYQADENFHMNPAAAKLIEEGFHSEQENKKGTETLRNMIRLFIFEHFISEENLKVRIFNDLGGGIKAVFEDKYSKE